MTQLFLVCGDEPDSERFVEARDSLSAITLWKHHTNFEVTCTGCYPVPAPTGQPRVLKWDFNDTRAVSAAHVPPPAAFSFYREPVSR